MTFLTGKHLDRRTLLKGVGAAIALPVLDAMRPALAASAKNAKQARRVAVVYVPERHHHEGLEAGRDGQRISPSRGSSSRLEPFREDITVLSGLANHAANQARGGGHAKATRQLSFRRPPKYTAGPDVHAGVTFDQVAAKHWAAETRVASLQIGCEDSRMVGNCDTGSSCAYTNSLSWKNPDTPLPVEVNPRSVFERLFGTADPSLSPDVRARRALYRKSILDQTRENTQRLMTDLGPADRRKMDEYLTGVREVEDAHRRRGERSGNAADREAFRNPVRVPRNT